MPEYSEHVRITGDATGYERALAGATAKTKAASSSWVSTLNRAGTSLTTFGKSATKWVTLPLLAAGVAAIKFAADAEETANKVVIAFGDSADAILDWSKTTIDKLGLASQTSQDMASSFGLLFSAAGITGTALVDLSKKFAILTADISSAFNVPFEEALMALRSGLVGETEPLRRFSIFLSEAALQQQALKMGLIETGGELTEQQKVMARSAFIMESLTERGVAGDMERTLGSTANQIRATGERLKEMAAEIGQDLLPVAQEFLGVAKGFIGFLTGMSEGARQNVIRLAALAIILGPVARLLGAAAKAAAGLTTALVAVKAAGLLGTGVLGALLLALPRLALSAPIAAGAMVELWNAIAPPGPGKAEGGIQAMAEANEALGEVARETLADLRGLAFQVAIYDNALRSGVNTQAEFDAEMAELQPRIDAVNQALAAAGVTYELTTQDLADLGHGHTVAGLSAEAQAEAEQAVQAETRAVAREAKAASRALVGFANLTEEEFQEWSADVTESIRGALGEIAGFQRGWELTGKALERTIDQMRVKADQFRRDIGEVARAKWVPEEFKKWLIDQGPDAVHAFAAANRKGKERMIEDWEAFERSLRKSIRTIRALGISVGTALGEGFTAGMAATGPAVRAAAERLAQQAIDQMRGTLGVESPSTIARQMGEDFVQGLIDGLEARQALVEKVFSQIERRLSNLVDRAQSFRSALAGSFGSFLDLQGALEAGVPIEEWIQQQAASAKQWAAVLRALQAQGLSGPLLEQIASMGPQALGMAQQLLQLGPEQIELINQQYQAILKVQERVSKALTETYFGDRINELRSELQDIRQTLHHIARRLDRLSGLQLAAAGQGGGVTGGPQFRLIGEGSYATPFGTGGEALVPLNEPTMDRLGAAIARHMPRGGDGGSQLVVVPVAWADDVGARVTTYQRGRAKHRTRL